MKYIFFSLDLLETKLTKTGNARRITKFSLKMKTTQNTPKNKMEREEGGGGRRKEKEGGKERGREGGGKEENI